MSKSKKKQKKNRTTKAKRSSNTSLSRNQLIWLGVILLITFIAYTPILQAEFINYDDDVYVTENPLIVNFNAENLKTLFTTYFFNQYSPVAMSIMAIEMRVFGAEPGVLKFISILIHLLNTLLVFQVIRRLFNRFDYAIITAALFGIHTLQVESVAWLAASMKIGTYTLFFLASILAYLKYIKQKETKWIILSLVLFILSCFSKEQAIALSITLVAIDYLKKRDLLSRQVILEKVPFFIISGIFAVVTLSVTDEMQGGNMNTYFSLGQKIIFVCYSVMAYFVKLILPVNLSAYYVYPLKSAIPVYYYLGPVFVIGILGLLYWVFKKNYRTIAFGLLFFFFNIGLTLASQVLSVRDVIMADRYVYIPCIGFFLILSYLLMKVLKKQPKLEKSIWGGLVVYGLLLAVLTFQRTKVWNNSRVLFTDVIEKGADEKGKGSPFLSLPYNNLGIALKAEGDTQAAMANYSKAIEANPSDAKSYLNRANINFNAQRYEEALPDYNKTLELDPNNEKAYSSRGAALASMGKLQEALQDFNKAIELDPNYLDALKNRAVTYYNINEFQKALEDLNRYLRIKPDDQNVAELRQLTQQQLSQ